MENCQDFRRKDRASKHNVIITSYLIRFLQSDGFLSANCGCRGVHRFAAGISTCVQKSLMSCCRIISPSGNPKRFWARSLGAGPDFGEFFTVCFLRSVLILAQIRANKRSRHLLKSPMKTGFYQRLQNRAKRLFIIRSQMLYPVELRAPGAG